MTPRTDVRWRIESGCGLPMIAPRLRQGTKEGVARRPGNARLSTIRRHRRSRLRNSGAFTSTRLRRSRRAMPAPVSMFQRLAVHAIRSTGSCPCTSARRPSTGRMPMPADDRRRSPEAKQRVVNDRRRCGREQSQRVGPRTVRGLGVDDPDRTVCGLDRDRKRHGLERGPPARMLAPRETEKPSGPSRRPRARPRPEPAQHGTIVVAQHNGVETVAQANRALPRNAGPD